MSAPRELVRSEMRSPFLWVLLLAGKSLRQASPRRAPLLWRVYVCVCVCVCVSVCVYLCECFRVCAGTTITVPRVYVRVYRPRQLSLSLCARDNSPNEGVTPLLRSGLCAAGAEQQTLDEQLLDACAQGDLSKAQVSFDTTLDPF